MEKNLKNNKNIGIFAAKSRKRLNSIGLSIVKFLGVENNVIFIEMVDMLNGTPLIDIKPFFTKIDNIRNTKSAWLDNQENIPIRDLRSDLRFK